MNARKICFILCTNNSLYFDECMDYVQRLKVPQGYEVEVLQIKDAKSMASGYNEGMMASDAKYKIYMHQDVFVVYPYFLDALIRIFSQDEKIGMIGMVGVKKLPKEGVMWHTQRVGALYLGNTPISNQVVEENPYATYHYSETDGLCEAEAIDGLLMATSVDVRWREDLLDGWDFYDVSQSLEIKRLGYRVVVPNQKIPWCLHDDGLLNLRNYNHYRQICRNEYKEFFS